MGSVSASDPDETDMVRYLIAGGNGAGKFAIDESAGQITVAGVLDYEVVTSYTLTVEASDGRGGVVAVDVAINIINVTVDYDADDDGLIEVSGLAQLNAIRRDCRHGVPFHRMHGLRVDRGLDFDTDGSGSADSGDAYWNDGSGWDPIGDRSNHFRAVFDGNGHSVSHLFIDRASTNRVGLFANTAALSVIRNVRLLSTDITDGSVVGGLVGYNDDTTVTASITARR